MTDVAEALSQTDFDITVFASRHSYNDSQTYPRKQHLNSVRIIRIWTTSFGRATVLGRVIDYLSFYLSATLNLLWFLAKDDVVVVKTDPPMLSIPLGFLAQIKGAKLVNWLQDVFPEVAVALSEKPRKGIFIGALCFFRNRSFLQANMNVAIGPYMANKIVELGIAPERVSVIENFTDDVSITRSENYAPELRCDWGIEPSDFIVGYSGNLGRAHDLATMLDVASAMVDRNDIKFLFIGGGALHQTLAKAIQQRSLCNVLIKPYQPREQLRTSLSLPNIHWASLKPRLEGYIVPSKIYGIAAAGRPLIMVGEESGEIGQWVSKFQFGRCFPPGAGDQIESYIRNLADKRDELKPMGENARRFITERRSKLHAVKKWEELLQKVASQG